MFKGGRGEGEEVNDASDVGFEGGKGQVEVDRPLVICGDGLVSSSGQVFGSRLTDDEGGAGGELVMDCSGKAKIFFAEIGV